MRLLHLGICPCRLLTPEDAQTAEGQRLHLILAGIDDNGSNEGHAAADLLVDRIGVGDAAGQQDGVHLAADAGRRLADELGHVQGHGVVDQLGVRVAVLDKDMIGIPWLLAFALRADGWYLRSDIIWMKANPMPESTKDRPSRCYEHIFLLSKSRRYYYDAAAIAEPVAETTVRRMKGARSTATKHGSGIPGQQNIQKINLPRAAGTYTDADIPQLRNKRDVWQINTVPYRGGHFAAFPPKLAETCLLAGCPPEGVVLDPFLGSGTTAAVARQLGRHYIGIELNPDYCKLAEKRIGGVTV